MTDLRFLIETRFKDLEKQIRCEEQLTLSQLINTLSENLTIKTDTGHYINNVSLHNDYDDIVLISTKNNDYNYNLFKNQLSNFIDDSDIDVPLWFSHNENNSTEIIVNGFFVENEQIILTTENLANA